MTRKADRKPPYRNAFPLPATHQEAAWRLPQSPPDGGTGVRHTPGGPDRPPRQHTGHFEAVDRSSGHIGAALAGTLAEAR